MGNKIENIKMDNRHKKLILISSLIVICVVLLFPVGNKILLRVRSHNSKPYTLSMQSYELPKNLTVKDTKELSEAIAVPILMYHGVITKGELGPNTTRENFISQMEMLKSEGYETISLSDFEKFKQGKFKLPPKPIIITFDDGRKDSFYTVDKIFEKLGFSATLFVATIKADNNDPFYLSWQELNKVKSTGRWDIQAHGKRSHEEIVIDENGNKGRFYSSRIYDPVRGLESVVDYKKRIEQDYQDGINDLKNNLGIDPKYFAIPLSDYGTEDSNYTASYGINTLLTKKYFTISLTQATAFNSFYNYKDSSLHGLMRLEVKNITSNELHSVLNKFDHKPELFSLKKGEEENNSEMIQLLYGVDSLENGTLTIEPTKMDPSARVLIGDRGWKNYQVSIDIERIGDKSNSLIVYYQDENNYISLFWGDNSSWITERVNSKEIEIARLKIPVLGNKSHMEARVYNGYLSASVNGFGIINYHKTLLSRGAVGVSVWNPKSIGKTIVTNLNVSPLKSMPSPYPVPLDSTGQVFQTQQY